MADIDPEPAGPESADELERLGNVHAVLVRVADHAVGPDVRRRGLVEGRVLHVERLEDVAADVLVERNAAHLLDDQPRERGAVVRVGGELAGRAHARGHVLLERGRDRLDLGRILDDQIAERAVFPAGGVRHEIADADRLPELVRDLEGLEIGVDVAVEIELSLLDELHDGGPGEELGGRANAEEALGRIDRNVLRNVLVAVALRIEHTTVLDDGDDGAGNVELFDVRLHDAVDEIAEGGGVIEGGGAHRGGDGGDGSRLAAVRTRALGRRLGGHLCARGSRQRHRQRRKECHARGASNGAPPLFRCHPVAPVGGGRPVYNIGIPNTARGHPCGGATPALEAHLVAAGLGHDANHVLIP